MDYIPAETLDALAEHLLIAAASPRNAEGQRTYPRFLDKSQAPDAVKAALNVLLGDGNWAPLTEWPKPEQMAGRR